MKRLNITDSKISLYRVISDFETPMIIYKTVNSTYIVNAGRYSVEILYNKVQSYLCYYRLPIGTNPPTALAIKGCSASVEWTFYTRVT